LRWWLFESMRSFALFASLAIVISKNILVPQLSKVTHLCVRVRVCVRVFACSAGGWSYSHRNFFRGDRAPEDGESIAGLVLHGLRP
jgi:hypothetical protein